MDRIFFVFLLTGCFLADLSSSQDCNRPSSCDNNTVREAIASLWTLTENLTELTADLKDAVLDELDGSSDSQLPYLMVMSLWAIDMSTGLTHNPPPADVYQGLIRATVDGRRSEINQAIREYGNLCRSAIDYSIQVGLNAAGCPNEMKTTEYPPTIINDYFDKFIDLKGDCIPCGIKDAIIALSESENNVDRTIATSALASLTDSSIELIDHLLSTGSMLRVVQLKGCKISISSACCQPREAELRLRCAVLGRFAGSKIGEMTREN